MVQVVKYCLKHAELVFLLAACLLLYFMQTGETGASLCLFSRIGISWCPGCGLGHSIHYALHAQFEASLNHHILGIPAILVILNRVRQLVFIRKQQFI